MNLRTVTSWSGVLGGLCWVVRAGLALAGTDEGAPVDALHWGGLVLLALALAGHGAGLVSRSAVWLRLIVAVAFPLLVWSVLEVLHTAGDPAVVDGVLGVVLLLVSARGMRGSGADRPADEHRRGHGAHAR